MRGFITIENFMDCNMIAHNCLDCQLKPRVRLKSDYRVKLGVGANKKVRFHDELIPYSTTGSTYTIKLNADAHEDIYEL